MSVPAAQTVLGAAVFGGPARLSFTETAVPRPQGGELLVKMSAFGVNPVDVHKLRQKPDGTPVPDGKVFIPGWDGAGVVAETGAGVTGFAPGDEVVFFQDGRKDGCYREWCCVDVRTAAHRPSGPSCPPLSDLAALPLAGITAWEALFEHLQLCPPGAESPAAAPAQRLLIIAGSGGVGSMAIQLAKLSPQPPHVTVTVSSPESAEWCRSLGADECITGHSAAAVTAALGKGPDPRPGADLVLNLGPPSELTGVADCLRPLGRVCLVGAGDFSKVDMGFFFFKRATVGCETVFARTRWDREPERQGAILAQLIALAAEGRLRCCAAVRSWKEHAEVLAAVDGRHTRGKYVMETR
eukprot:TRINITY_DN30764_c0_g1_i1.p1 TRINITY_DN30764_c0_g1~~TRINITY_DN30764_c0_g1_i1.p1  ORF type:complete len:380 (+),score=113.81 TRINITY_DN30764_c0_g1_i1:81-1142(+)